MNNYVIVTDTGSDLTKELIDELGVRVMNLELNIDGETPEVSNSVETVEFYKMLRAGKTATTSAIGIDRFIKEFEPILEEGKDVLYIGFSSGLSGTYNAGFVAAKELADKHPYRKIYTVDTLAASMGEGLLVWYAAKMKEEGRSIEEVRDFLEENKLSLCHWFTVNDLFFLKRGGRISAATAVMGTMLNIKPVLHVDNDGKLISVSKARGRRAAIDALFQKVKETAKDNVADQMIFISHGDCETDAKYLAEKICRELGVKDVKIGYIGPVIGAHSGPETLAVFFLGSQR
ncbi:MAG: DegV family protein [Ruminococcaceae bacterium]|nr:DegV family protein [Oscillospiraceae bacterium]